METMALPHNHEADRLFQEAETRLQSHRTEDATLLLQRALEIDAEHPESLSLFGVCLANRGLEFGRALQCCRRAIRHDPRNIEFHLNIAKVYKLMGDHQAAYKVLLRVWRGNPHDAQAACELARMGVRKQPPLPFLPRSHACNRLLGRLRGQLQSRLRNNWSGIIHAPQMQKTGHDS